MVKKTVYLEAGVGDFVKIMSEMNDESIVQVPTLLDVSGLVSSLVEIELSRKAGIFSGRNSRFCRRLVIDNYIKVMGGVEGGLLQQNREEFEYWLRETVLNEVRKGSGGSVRSSTFSCCICTVADERVVRFG
jgi:homospermidine synthase